MSEFFNCFYLKEFHRCLLTFLFTEQIMKLDPVTMIIALFSMVTGALFLGMSAKFGSSDLDLFCVIASIFFFVTSVVLCSYTIKEELFEAFQMSAAPLQEMYTGPACYSSCIDVLSCFSHIPIWLIEASRSIQNPEHKYYVFLNVRQCFKVFVQ